MNFIEKNHGLNEENNLRKILKKGFLMANLTTKTMNLKQLIL